MKRLFLILALSLFAYTVQAQLQISGKLRSLKPTTITIEDLNGKTILHQEIDKTGVYSTKKRSIATDLYKLKIDKYETFILLQNAPISIGGFYNEQAPEKSDITLKNAELHAKYGSMMGNFRQTSTAVRAVEDFIGAVSTKDEQLTMLAIVYLNIAYLPTEYELFNNLLTRCKEAKGTVIYTEFEKIVKSRSPFAINNEAYNFSAKDVNDKIHSLADFRGKIVLLDFWASWCGPCRAEMKSLHSIYDEIKGDDLQFISISLDDTKEKWVKALEEDKTPWLTLWENVSNHSGKKNFGFYDSVIRPSYGFGQIPFIVLIDKEGKTVKRFLRGEEVRNEIENLRKKYQ